MNNQARFTDETTCDLTAGSDIPYLRIADVKRDMDLIRKILLAVDAKEDSTPRVISIDGYDGALVARHIQMLQHTGFLEALVYKTLSNEQDMPLVIDLTWEGHDFAGAIADQTIFETVKGSLTPAQLLSVPLTAIKEVATKLVVATLSAKLGL